MIHILTNENDFETLIAPKSALVLVDFYAVWCEPCKWLDQILTAIEPKIGNLAGIVKVDINKFPAFQSSFVLQSVPVLMLFKKGQLVWRINGFLSEDELIKKIQSYV